MYWCYIDGQQPTDGCPICTDNLDSATGICQSEDFLNDEDAMAYEAPCYASPSCSGWSPTSEVWQNEITGEYQVSQTFVDSVISDPNKLVGCDGARVLARWSGTGVYVPGFVVSSASPGDLLYELGLRNGDIPTELNNYPLDDFGDVAAAAVALSFSDPSSYTLEVLRPGAPTVYIIVNVL